MPDLLVFHAHSRTKLKLGPEFIWGYEMRLEVFLEVPESALAAFWLFLSLGFLGKILVGWWGNQVGSILF